MAANKKKSKHVNQANRAKAAKKESFWLIGTFVAMGALLVVAFGILLVRTWGGPASVSPEAVSPESVSSMPAEIEDSLVIENGDEAAAQAIAEENEKMETAVEGFSEIAQASGFSSWESDGMSEEGVGEIEGGSIVVGGGLYGAPENDYVDPTPAPVVQTTIEPMPIETISFPYTISGTGLTVVQISPYNGYYLEDGSGDEIGNVATIVLKNDGGDLAFAGIGIAQGDRHLAFSGSNIPAGATVIIQEQNRAPYTEDLYYSATGTTTAGGLAASAAISITDNGNNTFTVTNTSGELIGSVAISYKSYLPEEDVYVGGITYTVNLGELEADASVVVNSSHYVSGYSVILSAQTN